MTSRPNVLFVTLDQFRSDALGCAGHPVVKTPTLDAFALDGVRFANHYAASAPCAPGRAALYTGMYQMNNRVVANGTPLDDRFDNVARVARRNGYAPTLFGYTDQSVDPRTVTDETDARLFTYEGVLPGFDCELNLPGDCKAWLEWLSTLGYEVGTANETMSTEHERPAEHSISTFLTDHVVDWFEARTSAEPWFVHASYIRPHPPYSAPGEFSTMYDVADMPPAVPPEDDRHPMHNVLMGLPFTAAPSDADGVARMRAQYYGMISHVDAQLARVVGAIQARGEWDNTVVIVTADHGEQLGDQGFIEKALFFDPSYHIIAIIRDPRVAGGRGSVVEAFTEAVDVLPTVCEMIDAPIPAQCDGVPLTPFLKGEQPPWWRTAAHYEWDWRDVFIPATSDEWPWQRRLEQQRLVAQRSVNYCYVHFGDGSWRCYDLAADPTWRTLTTDPHVVLGEAQALLTWQSEHLDRAMTGMLMRNGGLGRWPLPHPDGAEPSVAKQHAPAGY